MLQGKECHSFPHDVALQGIIDAVAPEHDHGGGEALESTPGISPSKQADNMWMRHSAHERDLFSEIVQVLQSKTV